MEFRARYQIIGIFSIAVILAAFAFIYWLNNKGFGPRLAYRVDFSEPVSGLSIGGAVLFNGVRVGEVTAIRLDGKRPGHLLVDISIAAGTPVRKDTLVGVDFQGLTGAASILLSGGSADAPALTPRDGRPVVLRADPDASRSWTRSASRLLSSLESWIGRNSGRLDGIIAGLERMTGGAKGNMPAYDLPAAQGTEKSAGTLPALLVVEEPGASLALNNDRLHVHFSDNSLKVMKDARWVDNLPNLVQTRIIQSFENAGYINRVLRPRDAVDPPFKLLIDIRNFYIDSKNRKESEAVIDFVAKLVDENGKIVAARPFGAHARASADSPGDAARALASLFAGLERELVAWTARNMPEPAGGDEGGKEDGEAGFDGE